MSEVPLVETMCRRDRPSGLALVKMRVSTRCAYIVVSHRLGLGGDGHPTYDGRRDVGEAGLWRSVESGDAVGAG